MVKRPPHSATVVQRRAPHPATVVQPKAPHPATVMQGRGLPPHPATAVQPKAVQSAAVVQRKALPPHPATVIQPRIAHAGAPHRPHRPLTIQRSVKTEKNIDDDIEMDQVFKALKHATFVNSRGEIVPVPFQYPPDGCYARAHLMSQMLTKAGYRNDKIFLISTKGLKASSIYGSDLVDYGASLEVSWWYHVAPIVYAQDNIKPTPYVVDPSLGNGPLSLKDWVKAMTSEQPLLISYSELVKKLVNAGVYNGTYLVVSGRDVYTPPSASNPSNASLGPSSYNSSEVALLTTYADRAAAHEISARIQRILKGVSDGLQNDRDAQVPYPSYSSDLADLLNRIKATAKKWRQYVVDSFPKLLTDLYYTVIGNYHLENDYKSIAAALNA